MVSTEEDTFVQVEISQDSGNTLYESSKRVGKVHTIQLNGLIAGRAADLRFTIDDASGNRLEENLTNAFTTDTNADNSAPTLAEAVQVIGKSHDRVKLSWAANEPVFYSLTYASAIGAQTLGSMNTLEYETKAQAVVAGLSAGTRYHWQLVLEDMSGNRATFSGDFTTAAQPDATAPVLDSVTVELSEQRSRVQTALLTGTCSEICDAYVQYGLADTNLQHYAPAQREGTTLRVLLPELEQASTYYYQFVMTDTAGNTSRSELLEVTTPVFVLDSDRDGVPDVVDDFPFDPTEWVDNDEDGIGDVADTDDDNDGVPDTEDEFPLDPNFTGKEFEDLLDQPNAPGTQRPITVRTPDQTGAEEIADTTAPVFPTLPDINVNARGALTPVSFDTVFATDDQDGSVRARLLSKRVFAPGAHEVTWRAEDRAGNTQTATQSVLVHPRVHLGKITHALEGQELRLPVVLDGQAARYPVTVNFSLAGTADSEDYRLQNAEQTLVITEGVEGVIALTVLEDAVFDANETIVIALTSAANATLDGNNQQQVRITETLPSPLVNWSVTQNDRESRRVGTTEGTVSVSVTTNLPTTAQIQYEWQAEGELLTNLSENLASDTFVFDPQDLSAGVYALTLTLYEGVSTTGVSRHNLAIKVMDTAANTSRLADQDNDGIPDLQDQHAVAHVLQIDASTNGSPEQQSWLETDPGLRLTMGKRALRAESEAAVINWQDIVTEFADAGQVIPSEPVTEDDNLVLDMASEVFDFEVHNLSEAGSAINVVLPIPDGIPAQGAYYKLTSSGEWALFTEDANNAIASAQTTGGLCPAATSDAYTTGLTQGHTCVRLTIQDGGPNDEDAQVNGVIQDPGIIAAPRAASATTTSSDSAGSNSLDVSEESVNQTDNSATSEGESSGGSISLWLLMLIGALKIARRQ